jgi:hypothetical protein
MMRTVTVMAYWFSFSNFRPAGGPGQTREKLRIHWHGRKSLHTIEAEMTSGQHGTQSRESESKQTYPLSGRLLTRTWIDIMIIVRVLVAAAGPDLGPDSKSSVCGPGPTAACVRRS